MIICSLSMIVPSKSNKTTGFLLSKNLEYDHNRIPITSTTIQEGKFLTAKGSQWNAIAARRSNPVNINMTANASPLLRSGEYVLITQ